MIKVVSEIDIAVVVTVEPQKQSAYCGCYILKSLFGAKSSVLTRSSRYLRLRDRIAGSYSLNLVRNRCSRDCIRTGGSHSSIGHRR